MRWSCGPRRRIFEKGAYLVSAAAWFVYGLQKHDRNIYLPCLGWIAVDAAVILGVLVNG